MPLTGKVRRLSDAHTAELAGSGIPHDYALANGVSTEADPAKVAGLLNWDRPATTLGPCLVFEHRDAAGRPTGFARLKPSTPRTERREGGERKIMYETPRKCPLRLFVPTGTRPAFADPSVPLLITEGEKKALSADYHGFSCVSLPGVWGWRKDGAMIPDMAAVAWRGRRVFVVFDSDVDRNPNVRAAERALVSALGERGATVAVVRLPEGGAA